eukprot:gene14486-17125_t
MGFACKSKTTPQQKTPEQVVVLEEIFQQGLRNGEGRSSRIPENEALEAVNKISPIDKRLKLEQVVSWFSRRFVKHKNTVRNMIVNRQVEQAIAHPDVEPGASPDAIPSTNAFDSSTTTQAGTPNTVDTTVQGQPSSVISRKEDKRRQVEATGRAELEKILLTEPHERGQYISRLKVDVSKAVLCCCKSTEMRNIVGRKVPLVLELTNLVRDTPVPVADPPAPTERHGTHLENTAAEPMETSTNDARPATQPAPTEQIVHSEVQQIQSEALVARNDTELVIQKTTPEDRKPENEECEVVDLLRNRFQ